MGAIVWRLDRKKSDARKRFQFKFGGLRNALETLSIEFGRVLETRGR